MKTVPSAVLVLALVFLSACAPKVNDPADIQAVKQTAEAFTKAINAADAPGAVAMMTDKTAWFETHMPVMIGKEAGATFLKAFFDGFKLEVITAVTDVRVEGNLGVMHGTFKEKATPKAEGLAEATGGGNWMVALQRQGDGAWKWDVFMVTSDQPMPGTTADGAEEQAVMQFERDGVNAMLKRDMAFIDRSLAKEYTSVADGKVNDMTKMMAEYKAGAIQFESFTLRDLKAYVFGDAAIATMTAASKGTYKGKPVFDTSRVIDFLVKRDGRWQLVSTQSTTIKQ
jgi:ketosteroid isomerase-like protein